VARAAGSLVSAGRRTEAARDRLAGLESRVRSACDADELATLKAALLRETEALARDALRMAERLDDVGETVQLAHAEIASLQHELARSRNLSLTDPLTGVANRRGLEDWVARTLTGDDGELAAFSLVVLDLDHFKQINDQHGHAAGDEVLVEVSRRLLKCVREEDFVARIGGEEFCLVLPGCAVPEAEAVATRVLATVRRRPVDTGRETIHLTTSAGVAEHASGTGLPATFERADRALYAAKAAGRNLVCGGPLPEGGARLD